MRRALRLAAALAAIGAAIFLYARGTAEPPQANQPAQAAAAASEPSREYLPPPFGDRMVNAPDPSAPRVSETAAFCDERNWSRLDLVVDYRGNGEISVDEAAWDKALASTKAGFASWLSQCHEAGGGIVIVAGSTGTRLASYDPQSGLHLAER